MMDNFLEGLSIAATVMLIIVYMILMYRGRSGIALLLCISLVVGIIILFVLTGKGFVGGNRLLISAFILGSLGYLAGYVYGGKLRCPKCNQWFSGRLIREEKKEEGWLTKTTATTSTFQCKECGETWTWSQSSGDYGDY